MSSPPPPSSGLPGRWDERPRLHRVLIILGPVGLALDLLLSLWVSYLHVGRSAVVQVETQWIPGERLAARTLLVDRRLGGVEGARASLDLWRDGESWSLSDLEPVATGLAQGIVEVPALPPGPAELRIEIAGPAGEAMRETIPVEIVTERPVRAPVHTISSSVLQWADDTDPQPDALRIDLLPFGRILAGFRNEFLVRVTDPQGKPRAGPVEIRLVHGELDGRAGRERDPPVLHAGSTDALGLVRVAGILSSDVIRIEVQIPPSPPGFGGPVASPPATRRFRLVSYPGGVSVAVDPMAVRPGTVLELAPEALRRGRPIFLDLHAPDGAWIDTLTPPFRPGEPPRAWGLPEVVREGFVQIEAYHYTNDPGEGTALARFHVGASDPGTVQSLRPLLERQRERLDVPRLDKSFDIERERRYLDHVAAASLTPAEIETVRRWLIGSLPIEVYGPPTALTTMHRDEVALRERRERLFLALRVLLWGGGGLFLAVMGVSLRRAGREMALRMTEVLGHGEMGAEGGQLLLVQRRAVLFRGAIVLAIVATGLALIVYMMENFIWIP